MKPKLAINKFTALALAAGLILGSLVPSTSLAQNTDDKIALMSAALKARTSGNLQSAKRYLEELNSIAPGDAAVQTLLADVNQEIAAQGGGTVSFANNRPAPSVAPAPTVAPAPVQPAAAPAQSSSSGSRPWWMKKSNDSAPVDEAQDEVTRMLEEQALKQEQQIEEAETAMKGVRSLIDTGLFEQAHTEIDAALAKVPESEDTAELIADLTATKGDIYIAEALDAVEQGNVQLALDYIDTHVETMGGVTKESRMASRVVAAYEKDPSKLGPDSEFIANERKLQALITKGKAQYVAGNFDGARTTFGEVESQDPDNVQAKYYVTKISQLEGERAIWDHEKSREEMHAQVRRSWQFPRVFDRDPIDEVDPTGGTVLKKMRLITLERVNFSGVPLSRVVETLSALSEQKDPDGTGVNMIIIDPSGNDPLVNLTLRNLDLENILDFVVDSVGYEYNIESDVVVIRPSGGDTGNRLLTDFIPLTTATEIRLIGPDENASGGGGGSLFDDPFAPPSASTPVSSGASNERETKLKDFFQRGGVPFDSIPGASLARVEGQIIVTNNARNIEKIRTILQRFSDIKQVEIEAKFLEVQQNRLDELGFNWTVTSADGNSVYQTANRTLGNTFGIAQQVKNTTIAANSSVDPITGLVSEGLDVNIPNAPPIIPNSIDLGADIETQAGIEDGRISGADLLGEGIINNWDVNMIVRALSRTENADLMSAPKVTVLSGRTAEITVAQELLYPESYGDIEAEVSTGGGGGVGVAGAAVAVTAGTPQDFVIRNVGVEMEVTPNVEEDDSISLLLEPRVTEFEGFVEWGGPSVAVTGGVTVIVPTGFFQPIFSVRKVRTEVTIWNGATVIMGGLTREEVKDVVDKVPVLGDIPILGRLFRSEGETSQKRNLLIFVTANLISPGGSPAKEAFPGLLPGQLFRSPTLVTPGGPVGRSASRTVR